MSPSTTSKVTTDHGEIRRWAEERGAKPAAVLRTESGDDPGMIRLDFPRHSGEGSLEEISWEKWFRKFDEHNLALLYQDQIAGGGRSNFNKIISRHTAEEAENAVGGKGRSASQKRADSAQARSRAGSSRNSSRRSSETSGSRSRRSGRKTSSRPREVT